MRRASTALALGRAPVAGVLCLCLGLAGPPAHAGQTTFELRERLNRAWDRQPVSFPFQAEAGTCHVGSPRLTGPDGPVACQFSDVETWPGGTHVKSAKVWFVTALKPLETRSYRLSYGPKPAQGRPPTADLEVAQQRDRAEVTTSRFGIRLSLGTRRYRRGAKPSDVPAPVIAMRLGDGTWFGASRLYGDTKLTRFSGRLVAEGPVFAEAAYRYEYADGNRLDLTIRLAAGGQRVLVDAEVKQDNPEEGLGIAVSQNLPALTFVVQKLWWTKRDVYGKETGIGDWAEVPLEPYPPGLVTNLSPWGPWWDDFTQPVVRLKIEDHPRELHISRRDPGAWVSPAPTGTFHTGPGLEHKYLAIRKSKTGVIFADLNFAAGSAGGIRRFAIGTGEPTEAVGWRHRRDVEGTIGRKGRRVGSQVIPYHEPLNVVKDYVLDWPASVKHPTVFIGPEALAAARAQPLASERNRPAWLALKPAHIPEEEWMKGPLSEKVRAHYGWTERITVHPHGSDAHRLAPYLLTGRKEVGELLHLAPTLRRHLGLLGDFDKMRFTQLVVGLYDALIDSELVTDKQRAMLRAQMAYLGYQLAHPATWSIERGYNSGNLNMSVAYLLSLGTVACAVPEHPKAREWVKPALAMMDLMLEKIGPAGEWPEASGYSHVSASHLMGFAITATRAGFKDYVNDPRLKKLMLYLAKCYTPPDPRDPQGVAGVRRLIPFGRAGGGGLHTLIGVMARATRDSDPDYAASLQWVWKGMGAPISNLGDWRLGGFEYVYLDPTQTAQVPDWTGDRFPKMGVTFRHGLGTDKEYYLAALSGDHTHMIYGSQTGSIASFFARGAPIGGAFWGSYQDQEEFLTCRVSLARRPGSVEDRRRRFGYLGGSSNTGFFFEDRPPARFGEQPGAGTTSAFSTLPRQDYAAIDVAIQRPQNLGHMKVHEDLPWPPLAAGEGQPPVQWRRQILFLKDPDPAGACYLLVRDTVQGGEPTMWTFWSETERIGTPEEAADRKAFLAQAPGNQVARPRALSGDRFTGIGKFNVDVEYYVAAPTGTPRHTLRWGTGYAYHPLYKYQQYQDLLVLQRTDDGPYFVALFPRDREAPAPTFQTLAGGTVIRVAGAFGTDWGFLSATSAEAEADLVGFRGTAASVQSRGERTVLSLGAQGRVQFRDIRLESDKPASLAWTRTDRLTVRLPEAHGGTRLRLGSPSRYRPDQPKVRAEEVENDLVLTVPAEVIEFHLLRR